MTEVHLVIGSVGVLLLVVAAVYSVVMLAAVFPHGPETRWIRTIRVLYPARFASLLVALSLPLALAGFLLSHAIAGLHEVGVALLMTSINARMFIHRFTKPAHDGSGRVGLWLVPMHDFRLVGGWLRAMLTSRLSSRGVQPRMGSRGVIRSK